MKRLAYLLLLCAACTLPACALVESIPDPSLAMPKMQAHPDRMVVVTVANPRQSFALSAGSTGNGYSNTYNTSGSARATLAAIAHQYELTHVMAWPISALGVHCAVLEIEDGRSRKAVLDMLAADPRVQLAEPLQTFEAQSETSPEKRYTSLQKTVHEIGADAAHRVALGDSIRIALIDTGVDTEHPDLRSRIASTRNFVNSDWAQFNRDEHGTKVAGVIAADGGGQSSSSITGIAPRARLVAMKACWQNAGSGATCNSLTLAQAIQAALDARADVINLSLGGPADPLLSALVEQAIKKGVVVVGAVLPSGDLKAFPVGIPGVIGVATATFANRAPALQASTLLYAPGHDILTLTPGGHYDFVSGSSFAAAQVTGSVALLLAATPGVDPSAIHGVLERTSGPNQHYARLINTCRALAALRSGCNESLAP